MSVDGGDVGVLAAGRAGLEEFGTGWGVEVLLSSEGGEKEGG